MGDPTRVRILELLLGGEKSVGELVDQLSLPQGRVSTHLACLRWCGFVASRRQGRCVYYRVTDLRVRELLRLARALIAHNAAQILTCQIMR